MLALDKPWFLCIWLKICFCWLWIRGGENPLIDQCVWLCLQYVLKPTFTKQHIAGLDKQGKLYRAYDGTTYLPGIVGLNNIKANDYANVVLQVLKPWTEP